MKAKYDLTKIEVPHTVRWKRSDHIFDYGIFAILVASYAFVAFLLLFSDKQVSPVGRLLLNFGAPLFGLPGIYISINVFFKLFSARKLVHITSTQFTHRDIYGTTVIDWKDVIAYKSINYYGMDLGPSYVFLLYNYQGNNLIGSFDVTGLDHYEIRELVGRLIAIQGRPLKERSKVASESRANRNIEKLTFWFVLKQFRFFRWAIGQDVLKPV